MQSPRIHVALAVTDLERSIAFYRDLLGIEPTKRKPQYAKFDAPTPSVNLTLNRVAADVIGSVGPQHFGIEVPDTASVEAARERMQAAGHGVEVEQGVTCCYAVQDKVWVADPDGHRWEIFTVLEAEADSYAPVKAGAKAGAETGDRDCCEPTCCQ